MSNHLATYLRDGRGESLRSIEAKENDRYPASHIARFIGKGVTAADVAEVMIPCEAHHTGKYAKLTEFYNWAEVTDDVIAKILAARDARKSAGDETGQYRIVYKEFTRLYGRWHCTTHEYEGEATIKGAFIHFDGQKKRLESKNLSYEKLD